MKATPPNIQRLIPEILIPCLSETKAWPSSCSRIEPKKSRAPATASA
jgi:hypothetical protein